MATIPQIQPRQIGPQTSGGVVSDAFVPQVRTPDLPRRPLPSVPNAPPMPSADVAAAPYEAIADLGFKIAGLAAERYNVMQKTKHATQSNLLLAKMNTRFGEIERAARLNSNPDHEQFMGSLQEGLRDFEKDLDNDQEVDPRVKEDFRNSKYALAKSEFLDQNENYAVGKKIEYADASKEVALRGVINRMSEKPFDYMRTVEGIRDMKGILDDSNWYNGPGKVVFDRQKTRKESLDDIADVAMQEDPERFLQNLKDGWGKFSDFVEDPADKIDVEKNYDLTPAERAQYMKQAEIGSAQRRRTDSSEIARQMDLALDAAENTGENVPGSTPEELQVAVAGGDFNNAAVSNWIARSMAIQMQIPVRKMAKGLSFELQRAVVMQELNPIPGDNYNTTLAARSRELQRIDREEAAAKDDQVEYLLNDVGYVGTGSLKDQWPVLEREAEKRGMPPLGLSDKQISQLAVDWNSNKVGERSIGRFSIVENMEKGMSPEMFRATTAQLVKSGFANDFELYTVRDPNGNPIPEALNLLGQSSDAPKDEDLNQKPVFKEAGQEPSKYDDATSLAFGTDIKDELRRPFQRLVRVYAGNTGASPEEAASAVYKTFIGKTYDNIVVDSVGSSEVRAMVKKSENAPLVPIGTLFRDPALIEGFTTPGGTNLEFTQAYLKNIGRAADVERVIGVDPGAMSLKAKEVLMRAGRPKTTVELLSNALKASLYDRPGIQTGGDANFIATTIREGPFRRDVAERNGIDEEALVLMDNQGFPVYEMVGKKLRRVALFGSDLEAIAKQESLRTTAMSDIQIEAVAAGVGGIVKAGKKAITALGEDGRASALMMLAR